MKSLGYLSKKIEFKQAINYLLYVFILLAIAISLQKLFQGQRDFWGHTQTHYNNYVIFKTSFIHLVEQVNLYDLYEKEYGDFYKYSPTFAVLMAPFYYLPDWLGLILWNLLNCLFLFYGFVKLPNLTDKVKSFILALSILELITSMQNQQSNAMIAGFLLLAFVSFEKNKIPQAAFLIMLCLFIKLTGALACVLFLFYRDKPKFVIWSFIWFIGMAALPLLFVDLNYLVLQYENWGKLLAEDHLQSYGISIFGIIHSWFNSEPSKAIVLIIGLLFFLLPLIRTDRFKEYDFRLKYLCALLIWIVIFNHKAESSSYIVAIAGCAIWFFISDKSILNVFLIFLAFVLISLSPTDIFPKAIRESLIVPLVLKAVPALLIWIKITFELSSFGNQRYFRKNFPAKEMQK